MKTATGTGIDIVEVARIGRMARDRKFLTRVFTSEEIAYCRGKKNIAQHLAVRFAAKEAILKAIGRKGIALKDVGVRNEPNGRPVPVVRGRYRGLARRLVISLAHADEYAVATATLFT